MKELSKTYEPGAVEHEIIAFWSKNNFYAPSADSNKPKFSIVIPPPNVTGNLHMGHMLNNTIQDIYARWKRMSGYNTLWLPGADHAGISTQTKVEGKLRAEGISRYDLGREKFVEKVWEWKEVYHKNIVQQLTRMGASVDWNRERFTMDEGLSVAVRKVFVDLYKKGLIYKGKRIINWDPEQQTALSDEEVIYKEKNDKLYYVKYPLLEDKNKFVIIATTRPETMLGDTAIAVNPNDERYTNIAGKKVILPIVDKAIPVIADEYVEMEFGTGALKITPAHDPNDFMIGEKYNLESVQVIDHTGKMNELAGRYSGLDRFEARKAIVEKLKELDLIEKIEDYTHNVGFSERGGAQVEPYLSDQWFVSMKQLAEPALNAVRSGEIKFHPERWVKTYENWMTNIRDWCISRQLWWGHQIPVWYNKNNGEIYCEVNPPADVENWEQDPDVLDTWFSSWLWPFSTMGWPEETEDLKKYFPTDFLSTAADIIFFWVARMIMASLEFTGKIPFSDVYFHNIVRDEKGRKMSKSLGNSPDVIEVMNEYGTDALRFTLVYLAPQGTDILFAKEKCEIGRNFANKLWNAARFLLMKKEQSAGNKAPYEKDVFDLWIESRFQSALKQYLKALNEYKINEASAALYDFIWGDFCDWYIEILKIKANDNPASGEAIFENAINIFEDSIKLLHPVMPFITEELWQGIKERQADESISVSDMPQFDESIISIDAENKVNTIQQLMAAARNLRAEMGLSPSVKCYITINCREAGDSAFINSVAGYIKSLAKIESLEITAGADAPAYKSVTAVVGSYQVYLKIEGLIDIEQEKAKLKKEIERTEGFINSVTKKLSNEKFTSNASAEVVENERKKLDDNTQKLAKLKDHYKLISE
ncbi:MAG TPA: valine--tRNA ligase [Ignavibacteria bacterium]|nr:valine--tRNA ligase [Ignavibacteria bacterium]HRJ02885.1 valine--tRNA ligase [Ignavibacteria bacterium]